MVRIRKPQGFLCTVWQPRYGECSRFGWANACFCVAFERRFSYFEGGQWLALIVDSGSHIGIQSLQDYFSVVVFLDGSCSTAQASLE